MTEETKSRVIRPEEVGYAGLGDPLPQGQKDFIGTINTEEFERQYLGKDCVPKFIYPFPIGARVVVDGEHDARVSGYTMRKHNFFIGCSWWINGESKEEWFEPERVCLMK